MAVDVGGIDEVTARGCEAVEDLKAGLFAGFAPERHGTQAQPAHLQPCTAQICELHVLSLLKKDGMTGS
jgi:hypothetical protein